MSGDSTFQNLNPIRVVKEELTQDDNIIAIMGPTGSGKSTFISAATGRDFGIGHSLQSHTSQMTAIRVWWKGDPVVLVDTPGFDDTYLSDFDILKLVSDWLRATQNNPLKLCGILYLHRISDNRMAGATLKNLEMFQKLCGKDRFEKVILTTTMWPEKSSEEFETTEGRELELRKDYWAVMITKGSRIMRFDGGQRSAWSILDGLVKNRKQSIRIQRELSKRWKDVPDTEAGKQLHGILGSMIERQRNTLRQLVEEVAKTTDLEIKEVLMKEWLSLREEQNKMARDEQLLKSGLLGVRAFKNIFARGRQVTAHFPYEDRCRDLISDILKNAEQLNKIVHLFESDAKTMFDFLVTVLRSKRVLATKEQRRIVSLLHLLDRSIVQSGTSDGFEEIVTVVCPQMNTLLQERSISDGDILILAEPPRGKQNLKQHFRSNEGPSRLKRLIHDVFECLVYLHGHDFVHGNLEAGNIVLSEKGSVLVTASTFSDTMRDRGARDIPCDSTRWKAPEVLKGCPPTKSSDIWSFGCLCYEILAMARHQSNYRTVIDSLSNGRSPDLSNGAIDNDLIWIRELLGKCWSSDPKDRRSCEVIRPLIEKIRVDQRPHLDMANFEKLPLSAKLSSQFEYHDVYQILLSIIRSDTTMPPNDSEKSVDAGGHP